MSEKKKFNDKAELQKILNRLKQVKENDSDGEKQRKAFVDAEIAYGKADPAEGKVIRKKQQPGR